MRRWTGLANRNRSSALKRIPQTVRQIQSDPPAEGEGEAHYQPIQPMVQLGNLRKRYKGILGATGNEGDASAEGTDTCDPVAEP